MYLLLAKEIPDFNGRAATGNGGVNWEMSIDKSHLVAVTVGNAVDQILDMAERGADGGGGFSAAEPGVDFELLLSGSVVSGELEIEVEMFEIAGEFSPGAFHLDHFGFHLNLHAVGDIHGVR